MDTSSDNFEFRPRPCKHLSTVRNNEHTNFNCSEVSLEHVELFRKKLFTTSNKLNQDNHVLLHVNIAPTKRKSVHVQPHLKKNRTFGVQFHIPRGSARARVCKEVFLAAIKPIGRNRLDGIVKRFSASQSSAVEKRGGNRMRNKNSERKNKVCE